MFGLPVHHPTPLPQVPDADIEPVQELPRLEELHATEGADIKAGLVDEQGQGRHGTPSVSSAWLLNKAPERVATPAAPPAPPGMLLLLAPVVPPPASPKLPCSA